MTRHEPTARRRRAFRQPDLRILIVCGTAKTESVYFKGLRSVLATRTVDIKILERPRSPEQVVAYARDHCDFEDFDESWCVVDVDQYEREGGKVTAALSAAEEVGIRLAASNPCFEYWLLLHLADCAASFSDCTKVISMIRKHLKSYDKTSLRFSDFEEGVRLAVARGKQRDPSGKEHSLNPSSGVWMLVSRLLGEAG
jgi:hypothetical protein